MTRKDFELISGVDPVAASNARQSAFFASADRDGATQRDGFWLCDAHAADHDALVLEAQRDAEREQRESNGSVTTT